MLSEMSLSTNLKTILLNCPNKYNVLSHRPIDGPFIGVREGLGSSSLGSIYFINKSTRIIFLYDKKLFVSVVLASFKVQTNKLNKHNRIRFFIILFFLQKYMKKHLCKINFMILTYKQNKQKRYKSFYISILYLF